MPLPINAGYISGNPAHAIAAAGKRNAGRAMAKKATNPSREIRPRKENINQYKPSKNDLIDDLTTCILTALPPSISKSTVFPFKGHPVSQSAISNS